MAKEHAGEAGLIDADARGDRVDVVEQFSPAVALGEEPEVGGGAVRSVPAMVVRIDREALQSQRLCEARIAGRMFGEAVDDLHGCSRRRIRAPETGKDRVAVRAGDRKVFGLHGWLFR